MHGFFALVWHSANAETLAISARSSVTLRKIMIQLGYVERLWDSCDDECASVDAGCLDSIGERTDGEGSGTSDP